uniref:Uncharacterized protein n=1 Tax=Arundo donax TaxID=35708 RepID=A0A0A9A4I3_ARUDO
MHTFDIFFIFMNRD